MTSISDMLSPGQRWADGLFRVSFAKMAVFFWVFDIEQTGTLEKTYSNQYNRTYSAVKYSYEPQTHMSSDKDIEDVWRRPFTP